MHNRTATRPAGPARRRGVVRIWAAAIVAALALGYVVWDLDRDVLSAYMRLAAAVALILLVLWLDDVRTTRRLERIEARLDDRDRETYWRAYSDALADLGGIDGETSTDSGQLPPRR